MAKATKAKLQSYITKTRLINIIKEEPLSPRNWTTHITTSGAPAKGVKKKECLACAVGTVITRAQADGKAKNFSFQSLCTVDTSNQLDSSYFKALAKGKLYLTALSDLFEYECDKLNVNSCMYQNALIFFHDKAKISKKRNVEQWELDEYNNEKFIAEHKEAIKNHERKINKIKTKLISLIDKNYPNRVPLIQENRSMKMEALANTKYSDTGDGHDW